MDRIEQQVRRELGRFGPTARDTTHGDIVGVVRAWPAAVGETVARNAWPARFARDGTLHVNTASATWAFELGRLVTTILEQLRSELGETTPSALRFAPGPIPEPDPETAVQRMPDGPEIGAEHRAEAGVIAAAIEDEELRGYVVRAAAASLARAGEEPRSDRAF
jgi:Dna[CI] antecedent DciA-like protein